ncbi:MAG: DUF5685 family protein [Firmicutes bacterium]|nr:DUF5685 family protein [Bacillota bacterium]MCL1953258.1 DUF5685 family protein [Bacillota bacterium]
MFGYVLPVQEKLKNQEYALYNAFYCGICLDIKDRLGEFARLATGFDMTFFAILLSDITAQNVEFRVCKCIGNPLHKKSVVCRNTLMDTVADISVILAYYKIQDDIQDNESIKSKFVAKLFRKAYIKARTSSPQVDLLIRQSLQNLENLQKDNDISIDRLSHPFGELIKQLTILVAGDKTSDNLERLCYNIGKFVYLIDALDDLSEDIKKGTFNAFLHTLSSGCPEIFDKMTKSQVLDKHGTEIEFAINSTINMCISGFNSLDFSQSYSLLKNIIHLGLRKKLSQILSSKGKLKKSQTSRDMRRTKAQFRDSEKIQNSQSVSTIDEATTVD